MFDILKDTRGRTLSRRQVLAGAGLAAAGAALFSAGGLSLAAPALAKTAQAFPYKKLDVEEVGRIAYENYFTRFCAGTVMMGLLVPLREKVGEPYTSFPMDVVNWAHGGVAGWGTVCGTLTGAGVVAGLVGGDNAEHLVNDMMFWYSETNLPIYKPAKPAQADIRNQSVSDTPMCHVSVGKWMKKEGVGFFSPERKDRCARLSADVAMRMATLLNALADGAYRPSHQAVANVKQFGITAQLNCTECHGGGVPPVPGR
ncbi:MAG: hypothetical protein Kow0025_11210 [Thermodesulfovibrionales bacterium]